MGDRPSKIAIAITHQQDNSVMIRCVSKSPTLSVALAVNFMANLLDFFVSLSAAVAVIFYKSARLDLGNIVS